MDLKKQTYNYLIYIISIHFASEMWKILAHNNYPIHQERTPVPSCCIN